jgi:hypothetical protein
VAQFYRFNLLLALLVAVLPQCDDLVVACHLGEGAGQRRFLVNI